MKWSLLYLLLIPYSAQAAIRFVDIPNIELLTNGLIVTDVDIDGDGTDDVSVISDRSSIRVDSLRNEATISSIFTPPNIGGLTIPYESGEEIGETLPGSASWFNTLESLGSSNIIGCRSTGCAGLYGNGLNYIGVRLENNGEFGYGWIELNIPQRAQSGTINSFAYETELGTSIAAGVIPEPTSSILLLITSFSFLLRRR